MMLCSLTTRLYCTHCCQWRRGKEPGGNSHTKFLAVGKLSENLLIVGKLASKNAKFGAENHILQK